MSFIHAILIRIVYNYVIVNESNCLNIKIYRVIKNVLYFHRLKAFIFI